jgi:cell division protein FtsZ
MRNRGSALIGIGKASGTDEDRSIKAAIHAISSPILEASIKGAKHAIINITGGSGITLDDASKAVKTIKQAAGADLNIIFGVAVNEDLKDEIYVSVIATGLQNHLPQITSEEIKREISEVVKTMEINFDSENTRESLIKNPLPEEDKLSIKSEIELINSPFDDADEDEDEDDLPDFLK